MINNSYVSCRNLLYKTCRDYYSISRQLWFLFCMGIMIHMSFYTVFAQSAGKISGTVTDVQTKEPLISANVMILGTSLGAATDVEGNFYILNVPAGKYKFRLLWLDMQRLSKVMLL